MLSFLVRKCSAALPLVALAACESSTAPRPLPGGVEIRTTSSVVKVERTDGMRRATITATVENGSNRTVYYTYCGEGIAVRSGSDWNSVWRPVCAAIAVPPEPIAPGETKVVTIRVDESHHQPGLVVLLDPALTFRLEFLLLLKRSADEFVAVQPGESVSNPFRFAE
jgi:hypothetical protein